MPESNDLASSSLSHYYCLASRFSNRRLILLAFSTDPIVITCDKRGIKVNLLLERLCSVIYTKFGWSKYLSRNLTFSPGFYVDSNNISNSHKVLVVIVVVYVVICVYTCVHCMHLAHTHAQMFTHLECNARNTLHLHGFRYDWYFKETTATPKEKVG